MDAVEAMCEGEFPTGLKGWLLTAYGPGSAWEAGTMDPGELCPNFGHEEPRVDCCSCCVGACMVPESMNFPTANVFDVVIREYLMATGFLPMEEPIDLAQDREDETPF